MNHPELSPLALPFEDAICPTRLLAQITKSAEHQLRGEIAEFGNRALGLALAGAKFLSDSGTIQVVFEGGIPAGAKLMKSAGAALPALVDGKTGRVLKLGRVASKGRAAASIAASAALVVVEAAHMISGYDNAKRIKRVERGMDRLIHAHESELKSRLEAVYRYSKELLHNGPKSLTDEDRRELHRQSKDLMELRARWRDDFRHRISKIDKAESGFWNKVLWWRREDAEKKSRAGKSKESMDALGIIQMMHFSLMLQMALAGSSGRMEAFQNATLPDECAAWRSLSDFAKARVDEIAGSEECEEFQDFLGSIDQLVDFWEPKTAIALSGTPAKQTKPRPKTKKRPPQPKK